MRKTVFAKGEMYHLYNRGVEKRTIFTSPKEYDRFLAYLWLLNDSENVRVTDMLPKLLEAKPRGIGIPTERGKKPLVAVGAFCLMPNHIHLLVTPLVEGGISKYMQRVQTAYTMYFNNKHERTGALFQGTFKSAHVAEENYAKYIYSYIHLNPAKLKDRLWKERGPKDIKRLREFVRSYPYSSMGEYLARQHAVTDPSMFPEYFSKLKNINEHIDFWLEYKNLEV